MGTYRTAEVCPNGHVSTSSADTSPELREKFCSKCGEETTTRCSQCNSNIRGYFHVSGVISIGAGYSPPAFCHNCGKPFEWTSRKIGSAVELVKVGGELTESELEQFENDLNELTKDSPAVHVASIRFKAAMEKTGSAIATGVKEIIVNIVSEAAKRAIWGP